MTTFPILSSAQTEFQLYQDNPDGNTGCLEEACMAIDSAIAALNAPDGHTYLQPEPLAENLFHLHTFTLQVDAKPYRGLRRDLRRFTDFARKVQGATEAGTPLTLLPSAPNVIHDPRYIPDVVGKLGTPPLFAYVLNQRHLRKNTLVMPGRHSPILSHLAFEDLGTESRFYKNRGTSYDLQHWMNAVLALNPSLPPTRANMKGRDGRLHLRTGLEVLWLPTEKANSPGTDEDRQSPERADELDVEVQFAVRFHVYLDISLVEVPLPAIADDLYRYALAQLIYRSTQHQSETRTNYLHAFYESLSPAPSFPETFDQSVLQPRELLAKLLPFQRRTVNLLLQNEHAPMAAGAVQSRSFSKQWKELYFEGHGMFAFNLLTGELRRLTSDSKGKGRANVKDVVNGLPQVMSPAVVRGTMLCEEMGLGKTVEAIALMLLHPHPLSVPRPAVESEPPQRRQRSLNECEVNFDQPPMGLDTPEMSDWFDQQRKAFEGTTSWSEESQLNVSEVGATLVVTPATLLTQWVSELITHSPLLRVCVYPGWSVLVNQISTQQEVRRKVHRQREAERNKRKRSKFRNEVRSKYAKGSNGRIPVKQEDEGSSESDNEEDEDDQLLSLLQETQRSWLAYARSHDVVLTTYDTLGKDLQVAHPLPKRSRRSTATYVDRSEERPRSPLLMVEWWRVIMDEVQLQGRTSNAASMVALIPRRNSLAMSGTPARADITDLMGSLRFLRVPDLTEELWYRLSGPCRAQELHALFQSLAVRTTKVAVAHEFNIPKQERYIVPIELTNIEVHYYQDTLQRARERLGTYHQIGVPAEVLRHILRNLRQICTHIQVGALQQRAPQAAERAERLQLGRQLLTMGEALLKMRVDHEAAYSDLVKRQMRAMVSLAQYHVVNKKDDIREYKALGLYERARESGDGILAPARKSLAALLGDTEDVDMVEIPQKHISYAERDRIKQIIAVASLIRDTLMIVHQAWYFSGDAHHVLNQEKEEVEAYAHAELVRKELLSRPLKKANDAVEEMRVALKRETALSKLDDLLSDITNLRGGLHTERFVDQANPLLEILNDNATLLFSWRQKIIELMQQPIEGSDAAPAVGEGQDVEDPEAEYYALALKAQGELDAYFTAYAAALADRKEMLSEDRTFLEATEGRVTKKRQTATAGRALATAVDIQTLDETEELEQKLMLEREAFRARREEEGCTRPLKAVYIDINNTVHITGIRAEEAAIARRLATTLRSFVTKQKTLHERLSKELDMLRATFNLRVVYYKVLQEISDSVRPPHYKTSTLQKEIKHHQGLVDELELQIADNQAKGRYLRCLGTNDHDVHEECAICFGTSDDTHAVLLDCGHSFCVSCFREYRRALYIGNKCATCKAPIENRPYRAYRIRAEGEEGEEGEGEEGEEKPSSNDKATSSKSDTNADSRSSTSGTKANSPSSTSGTKANSPSSTSNTSASSPSNSKSVTPAPVARRKKKDRNIVIEEENTEDVEIAKDWSRLKLLSDERLRAVNRIEVMGEFGAKIMFLLKHLLWYRINFPETRHVVFSNWADSLRIVQRALEANNIRFVAFDSSTRTKDALSKFHNDPSISVFLLHAERESAGLTLTSCGVVHLLEPVLQHSFELQAIGRVDRLGQRKHTAVYCYATLNTVETRILCQAARKGTSIYLADSEEADLANDTMPNIVSAAHRGGDLDDFGRDNNNNDELMSLIM